MTEKHLFEDQFEVVELIANGTFGAVSKCTEKTTGRDFAVKVKKKSCLFTQGEVDFEMKIWASIRHSHIVQFYKGFESTDSFFLVLEYVCGGNLLDEIIRRTNYSERDACIFLTQVLTALEYLQFNRIVHRDIKPDNLLFFRSNNNHECVVKLTDFGLARKIPPNETTIICEPSGAPLYMAPETILEEPIGYNVDIWSCAVILHLILVGFPPFWDADDHKLFQQIVRANIHFTSPLWANISDTVQDLLRRMLVSEPSKRISASECLSHPWIKEVGSLPEEHQDEAQAEIKKFRAKMKFKGAVMSITASLKLLKLANDQS